MSTRHPKDGPILVADDDEDYLLLVSYAAQECDPPLEVEFVRDGRELLAYLRGDGPFADLPRPRRPSLLLVDAIMPGMSGVQVLTTLRRDETLRDIPTVLQSTLPDAAPRSPHFPTEQKPCTYNGLIEQLERLAR